MCEGILSAGIATLVLPVLLLAQEPGVTRLAVDDTAATVAFGGFVDAYYAYDFDRPPQLDRAFTTQAARHNEFNINLAFLEARLSSDRFHGRVAAQWGTSVQANYAGEPRVGSVSGPDVSRFIQEAYMGVKLARTLWVDGGVFFSHIGNETWISRDSWTYTRSLIAEYTPYYEAGVRTTWQATPRLLATGVVVNGWQNISETNSDKAVGIRLDYAARPSLTLSYDNFIGNEAPDTARARLRTFHEVIAKYAGPALGVAVSADLGTQRRAVGGGTSTWYGGAVIGRYVVTPRVAINGRVEYYSDPDQVIVAAPSTDGFQTWGGSVGVDVQPVPRLLWRTELRALAARDPVFPKQPDGADASAALSRRDSFIVTSMGVTF